MTPAAPNFFAPSAPGDRGKEGPNHQAREGVRIGIRVKVNAQFQPNSHYHCGLLPGYRISWEEYNRTNTRVTHYLPNVTLEYRVTGLTALTTYTIEVAAMTSKGQGQVSASTISSGVPPGRCLPLGCLPLLF